MTGNIIEIMGNARHVAADILTAVVDTRILQAEEGNLDELASAQRHVPRILGSDAKLQEVELVDVLQERTRICQYSSGRRATNTEDNQ